MDPSKSRKPSLPRLTTNIPAERQANVSLPLAPKNHPDANVQKPATGPKLFMDDTKDDENAFPTLRYAPDPKPFYVAPKNIEDSPVNKRMAVYYDELLSFRGPSNSPQERVAQDSVVVAELKTSHKAKVGEPKLVADLLFRLAQIYQRPETSIMVTFQQDTYVIFGSNTTLPAYLLKIYALHSCIAPVTNLRNTTLIQTALEELLGIPPSSGVVIYIPIPEDNLATNGKTVRDEILRLERTDQEDTSSGGLFKTISRGMSRRRLKSSSGNSAPISLPATTSPSTNTPIDVLQSPVRSEAVDEVIFDRQGRRISDVAGLKATVRRRLLGKLGVMTKEKETKDNEKDTEGQEEESKKEKQEKNEGEKKD